MRNLIIFIFWIITIKALIKSNKTINEINCSIKNMQDKSQTLLIDSLQLEIMDLGSKLDSMFVKYDQ
tara:strand:- start:1145 stop:1345 length:201 start_codon:yes stop_codon:yes gene_type:complete